MPSPPAGSCSSWATRISRRGRATTTRTAITNTRPSPPFRKRSPKRGWRRGGTSATPPHCPAASPARTRRGQRSTTRWSRPAAPPVPPERQRPGSSSPSTVRRAPETTTRHSTRHSKGTPMGRVVIFGSANADTVLSVEHFPEPGETIHAVGSKTGAGGKGLNQAVAAGRMGADAIMVGAIGTDAAGAALRDALANESGLDLAHLRAWEGPTGQAFVTVDAAGENHIVIVAGANGSHTAPRACENLDFLAAGDVLVCQLEIPFDATAAALEHGRARGALTVLNAAPAADVTHMLEWVDLLVVNETEAAAIIGGLGGRVNGASPGEDARFLCDHARTDVVITLGGDGLVFAGAAGTGSLPAHPITPVDTTGAGDAFVGGLAAMLAEGEPLAAALEFASALGALACTTPAAQGYTSTREDVLALAGSSR